MLGRSVVERVADEAAGVARVALAPDAERDLHRYYDRSCSGERLEVERLDEALGRRARARPGIHAATWAKRVVVAPRLAVRRLVLHAEVAAARLLARERVAAHQLAQLEEVGHAAGALELLVQLAGRRRARVTSSQNASRSAADLVDRLGQPVAAALEPARVPQHAAERAVEVARGAPAARRASSRLERAPAPRPRAARASGAVLGDRRRAARPAR